MYEKEQVHEIGATPEAMTERLAIYEHHQAEEAALVVATVAAAAAAAAVAAGGAGASFGPVHDAVSFDVVAHFLADSRSLPCRQSLTCLETVGG